MNGLPLDHVAIAVTDLAEAVRLHERLTGTPGSPVETLEAQGVRVAFVGAVELLEPLDAGSTVARFLERHGPGLHHLAYRTPDLGAELERVAAAGFDLVDARPRPGARGHRVAFLHPRGTGRVLVELVEVSGS
ncbi:MAG TPA: VOC family protein [Longimicrobiales bacterium]|nr:VOC family protein [Longimicrobiales bacterium]